MRIQIKQLNGLPMSVSLRSSQTVADLKEAVMREAAAVDSTITLIFAGRKLKDEEIVKDLGILHETPITAVIDQSSIDAAASPMRGSLRLRSLQSPHHSPHNPLRSPVAAHTLTVRITSLLGGNFTQNIGVFKPFDLIRSKVAEALGSEPEFVRLLYAGRVLREGDTPLSVGLHENAIIVAGIVPGGTVAGTSSGTIDLTVRDETGGRYNLVVNRTESFFLIKRKLEDIVGLLAPYQRLIHRGRPVEDKENPITIGCEKDAVFHVVRKRVDLKDTIPPKDSLKARCKRCNLLDAPFQIRPFCSNCLSEEVLLYDLDIESMYNKGTWEELVDAKGLCIPCKAEIRPSFGFLCAASLVERLPCPSRDPQLGRELQYAYSVTNDTMREEREKAMQESLEELISSMRSATDV